MGTGLFYKDKPIHYKYIRILSYGLDYSTKYIEIELDEPIDENPHLVYETTDSTTDISFDKKELIRQFIDLKRQSISKCQSDIQALRELSETLSYDVNPITESDIFESESTDTSLKYLKFLPSIQELLNKHLRRSLSYIGISIIDKDGSHIPFYWKSLEYGIEDRRNLLQLQKYTYSETMLFLSRIIFRPININAISLNCANYPIIVDFEEICQYLNSKGIPLSVNQLEREYNSNYITYKRYYYRKKIHILQSSGTDENKRQIDQLRDQLQADIGRLEVEKERILNGMTIQQLQAKLLQAEHKKRQADAEDLSTLQQQKRKQKIKAFRSLWESSERLYDDKKRVVQINSELEKKRKQLSELPNFQQMKNKYRRLLQQLPT